ncbi:phage protein GemA/Gp16 family protein [Pseudoalteromonas 'SMAR']|uniref:phage protein GemA/Gp16 family protein n=1 Tax=Pseudoalteromonas 'SMAR' TaxID=3416908 RepID=UPI003AF1FDBE
MTLVQQIKAAQRYAHISDEAHRQNVLEVSQYRVSSCTKLTIDERKTLLTRYHAMNPTHRKRKKLPQALRHIYRLWALLAKDGKVRVNSKAACEAFCKKHTQGVPLHKAQDDWQQLIEILKSWLERGQSDEHKQL